MHEFSHIGAGAIVAGAAILGGLAASQAGAQEQPSWSWPEAMENRQALPEGTGGADLRNRMISYVMGLGVRCQHCHVGEEGMPLSQFDFAADDREAKSIARGMISLTAALNEVQLPAVSGLEGPRVTCFTCHRGETTPATRPPSPES